MANICEDIRQFVIADILEGQDVGLEPATPLLELGIINSLSIVAIQRFVQTKYGVAIPAAELVPPNFETLLTITALVERLRGPGAGA